jgi:hypothetical protein
MPKVNGVLLKDSIYRGTKTFGFIGRIYDSINQQCIIGYEPSPVMDSNLKFTRI